MFSKNRVYITLCLRDTFHKYGFKVLKFYFTELELTDISALAERAPSAGETMIPLDILGEGKNLTSFS